MLDRKLRRRLQTLPIWCRALQRFPHARSAGFDPAQCCASWGEDSHLHALHASVAFCLMPWQLGRRAGVSQHHRQPSAPHLPVCPRARTPARPPICLSTTCYASLQAIKPAHSGEVEALEAELSKLYDRYLHK